MNHKKLDADMQRSFPVLSKSMNKSYEFTQQYNPELADLLRQVFIILLRPLVAFRAKLYRSFLRPFKKLEENKIPIFRLSVICIGLGLIAAKDFSVSFSLSNPLAAEGGGFFELGSATATAVSLSNEYAPVGAGDLQEVSAGEYVDKYKDVAISEMKKYGVPASITLGQALIESRAGNSRLARQNNNHFGIKCFSRKCTKGHCTNHFDDHHKDFFRKYDSVWESYRSHSKFLSKGRYAHLREAGNDYKKWAVGLKEAGYATDKRYDKKLIGIIQKYKLYEYDK